MIDWDRTNGARHYKTEACEAQIATEDERKAYEKHILAELKAWDGTGSFRPSGFGDFVHNKK